MSSMRNNTNLGRTSEQVPKLPPKLVYMGQHRQLTWMHEVEVFEGKPHKGRRAGMHSQVGLAPVVWQEASKHGDSWVAADPGNPAKRICVLVDLCTGDMASAESGSIGRRQRQAQRRNALPPSLLTSAPGFAAPAHQTLCWNRRTPGCASCLGFASAQCQQDHSKLITWAQTEIPGSNTGTPQPPGRTSCLLQSHIQPPIRSISSEYSVALTAQYPAHLHNDGWAAGVPCSYLLSHQFIQQHCRPQTLSIRAECSPVCAVIECGQVQLCLWP